MDGFLIINKPLGYTSRDVVNKVGKYLNTRKIGHTGTLDPKASGVMILALGKALKMCELMSNHDKEYIAEVILGIETDTLDMDTNATILKEVDVKIGDNAIKEAVDCFNGTYMQTVPKYSAIKVSGRKLYEYARSNTPVELPKKEVTINDISIISEISHRDNKVYFTIKCNVSKGTYIRSLVRDIGDKLGYPAVINSLTRTKQGIFSIDDSYTLSDIENNNYKLISITEAFPNISTVTVDINMAKKVKNGVVLDKFFDDELAFVIDDDDNLLALYENIDNKSRPYKMFI